MKIATIGEALIDFEETTHMTFHGHVGGCHLNVATAAARLGAEAGFAGQLSNDFFGAEIYGHMRENGVDDRFVLRSDAPTTLVFVSESGGNAHFRFFGEGTADRTYDPQPRPEFPSDLAFLMFGSVSLLHDPVRSSVRDVIRAHRERCTTVFDPNVRPRLVPDRDRYVDDVERWLPLSGLVKVSAQDLEWLYPGEASAAVAGRWADAGPAAVIVTRGAETIELYRSGRETLGVRPPSVEIVDTVGAGDAFTGALMATLTAWGVAGAPHAGIARLSADAWRVAMGRAAAAAALNCIRRGADPPTASELEAFLAERPGA